MAMNIISKEKKEIKWIGLPVTSFQESSTLTREREDIMARLDAKQAFLQDLIVQVYIVLIKYNFVKSFYLNLWYKYVYSKLHLSNLLKKIKNMNTYMAGLLLLQFLACHSLPLKLIQEL